MPQLVMDGNFVADARSQTLGSYERLTKGLNGQR